MLNFWEILVNYIICLLYTSAMTVCMVIANRLIKEANTGYKNTIDHLILKVLERI